MCGIVGYSHVSPSEHADPVVLADMCGTIIHRGPDDQGIYTHGQTGLAMRRLSIIDLHTGHQPIANETETVWIVQNGEIYNYQELAQWLLQRGHRLRTASDTEVIVHLYEELGERCLDRLRGMFAFAIWDQVQSSLFLARDRLGVKPLYYYWDEARLVFGSELKTLLAHPEVDASVDVTAIETFLRYSYIPDPQTIFTRIESCHPRTIWSSKTGNFLLSATGM
ncbi:MAG: asparagine synthetase B, partial [Nitrospira sp.]|nr:asparagine synthetase B [Nitrospira sp.]